MTDEDDVPRRRVLRAAATLGGAGVVGAAGGASYAAIADNVEFGSTNLLAGSLDLRVGVATGPTLPTAYASEGAPNATVAIEPGTTDGTVTIGTKVCGNPGYLWLRATGESGTDFADRLRVTLRIDAACDDAGDGQLLFVGSVTDLVRTYGTDGLLVRECSELGKLEYDDDEEVLYVEGNPDSAQRIDEEPTFRFGDVTVHITEVYRKADGEVIGVDVRLDGGRLCRGIVKGGGAPTGPGGAAPVPSGVEVHQFPACPVETTEGLIAGDNPAGNQSGLSHLRLFACTADDCLGCEPNCLRLEWTLVGGTEGLGEETLPLDLELLAEQCRHNDPPSDPWQ